VKRVSMRALLLILICLSCLPICRADETAAVTGLVTDPAGRSVPGVTILITNLATNVTSRTVTNDQGIYHIQFLQPGIYRMTVDKDGFKSIVKSGVELHVQDVASINFELQIGSVNETVTVSTGAQVINTTDAAVSTVIDRQFVENIPLNGRTLQSLITLTPGVLTVPGGNIGQQGEFSVNGQRTEANYFAVDGVSANTGADVFNFTGGIGGQVPAETQLGTTQSIIPLDALQEFRATTSTFSAEYGRTPGGQFSFVSRSGTNAWHGSAFDYFRNEALDANNWFSDAARIPKTRERQNDFGGTLGGPLSIPGLYNGKDRTFFFFSYEGLRLQLPAGAVTGQYPDASLRRNAPATIQPFLNAFPVPNGPEVLDSSGNPTGSALFTAAYSNPSNLDSLGIRADHNLTRNTKIFGRYSSTSSASQSRYSANLANPTENLGDIKSITIGATTIFTARLVNEVRFNYTRNDSGQHLLLDNFGGAQPFRLGQVPGFGGGQSDPLGDALTLRLLLAGSSLVDIINARAFQRQWNVNDAFSVTYGAHVLKFGLDYRRLSTLVKEQQLDEIATFIGQQQVLVGSARSAFASSAFSKPPEPVYTNFSAYAQDEWRLSSRLTLSLGLRWDVNPPPGSANGNPPYTLNQIADLNTAQLAPAGTPLWQTDYLGFAPRLGVAYLLGRSAGHETVVRGGFGIFYDMGNTLGSQGFYGPGFDSFVRYPNTPFPLTPAQLAAIPPPSIASPYNSQVFAFDPHLRLPYTMQWNFSVEQALGASQTLKLMYVGSAGRRLLFSDFLLPPTNPNFSSGNGLNLTTGRASSNYQAFQTEFQRRLSHGLQALASYTWSHSIDDGTSNFFTDQLLRGSSDFDIRHNFQMALTYDIPGSYSNPFLAGAMKHWGVDTRVSAQSAPPADIVCGLCGFLPNGQNISLRPNLVPNVPVYLYGAQYPGGRILNFNAFLLDPSGAEGNLARNFARAFGSAQLDMALRREFPLHERLRLQFRAEAFNILNHPNFGTVDSNITDGPFTITTANGKTTYSGFGGPTRTLNNSLGGNAGLSPLYQLGGPRSLQLALKVVF
jgi:hypothetical protein